MNSVSSMEIENFQAPFRVITSGSIQIENNQTEKPSTEELLGLAALKVAFYQTTQVQTEDDITDCVFENQAVNTAKQLCL